MNISQKFYQKVHLNDARAVIFFYILCTSLLLLPIKYSFHAKVRLVCQVFKNFFLKLSW